MEWKKIIIIPAANLSALEKNNKTFPNAEAATPREIKTNEKPKQNNIVLISNEGEISSILANGFVEQLGAKYMYSLKGGIQQLIKDNFNLFKN